MAHGDWGCVMLSSLILFIVWRHWRWSWNKTKVGLVLASLEAKDLYHSMTATMWVLSTPYCFHVLHVVFSVVVCLCQRCNLGLLGFFSSFFLGGRPEITGQQLLFFMLFSSLFCFLLYCLICIIFLQFVILGWWSSKLGFKGVQDFVCTTNLKNYGSCYGLKFLIFIFCHMVAMTSMMN